MKSARKEHRATLVSGIAGLAAAGILLATVVAALSPENLLRQDGRQALADHRGPQEAGFTRPA